MQQATITVAFVNPPKSPTGPGSVKDTEGKYWKVWTPKKPGDPSLENFVAGGVYSVTYKPGMYQGKPDDTITSVTQVGAAAAAPNGHAPAPRTNGYSPTRQATDPTDAERMFVCANLVAFIKAGAIQPDLTDVVGTTNMLRDVWTNTFGAK
jgi:hypothetical protein